MLRKTEELLELNLYLESLTGGRAALVPLILCSCQITDRIIERFSSMPPSWAFHDKVLPLLETNKNVILGATSLNYVLTNWAKMFEGNHIAGMGHHEFDYYDETRLLHDAWKWFENDSLVYRMLGIPPYTFEETRLKKKINSHLSEKPEDRLMRYILVATSDWNSEMRVHFFSKLSYTYSVDTRDRFDMHSHPLLEWEWEPESNLHAGSVMRSSHRNMRPFTGKISVKLEKLVIPSDSEYVSVRYLIGVSRVNKEAEPNRYENSAVASLVSPESSVQRSVYRGNRVLLIGEHPEDELATRLLGRQVHKLSEEHLSKLFEELTRAWNVNCVLQFLQGVYEVDRDLMERLFLSSERFAEKRISTDVLTPEHEAAFPILRDSFVVESAWVKSSDVVTPGSYCSIQEWYIRLGGWDFLPQRHKRYLPVKELTLTDRYYFLMPKLMVEELSQEVLLECLDVLLPQLQNDNPTQHLPPEILFHACNHFPWNM